MKLTEIFTQLTYGELSQISMGGGEAGEINEKNYDRLLSHINLGLTALYKRFPLKQGRLTVALQPGRLTYPLKAAFAVSNTASLEPVKYILDTESPFLEDIHKVEAVKTALEYELALNDEGDALSITTPSATVLRVPLAIVEASAELEEYYRTETLEVVYRANHPLLDQDTSGFDVESCEVELPYSHLEPLLYFVASRIHNPIGMVNEFNAGNNYAAKYEMACQALETANLNIDQGAQYDRLHSKGFV